MDVKAYLFDNLLTKMFLTIAAFIAVVIIIFLVMTCRQLVLTKCCRPFQQLMELLERKLIFNSILRACLETYLLVCIAVFQEMKL